MCVNTSHSNIVSWKPKWFIYSDSAVVHLGLHIPISQDYWFSYHFKGVEISLLMFDSLSSVLLLQSRTAKW